VIENLVGNALKYSPQGGPVIVEVVREAHLSDQSWAMLRVQDHGLGIASDDLPRVFEPFWRSARLSAQIRGTGVGLASAREIVERHGGRIEVASTEGAGSTFTVHLPLSIVEWARVVGPRSEPGVAPRVKPDAASKGELGSGWESEQPRLEVQHR
jgi:signal transduction histidine kinase